jgi:hypothetical protein
MILHCSGRIKTRLFIVLAGRRKGGCQSEKSAKADGSHNKK